MSAFTKIILITLGALIFISLLTNFFGRYQLKKLGEIAGFEDFPQIESILLEQILEFEEDDYKKFVSPDGKLKAAYPPNWLEITDEETLEQIFSEEWTDKYNLKTILLAQGIKEEKLAQLIISEGVFNIQFEEIIEEMKENNQEQGWNMEIIESSLEEQIFEAEYQKENQIDLHSKEKILLGEQGKNYLAAFIVFSKDWEEFKQEAEKIINSVQLID